MAGFEPDADPAPAVDLVRDFLAEWLDWEREQACPEGEAQKSGMFRRLFGGGRGEIRLVDPANVLESGIDIFAQPPGKKLENIGLLSGGEKSMTAVTRFINALREFANVSQYIVITHNKKTVMGAGTMLGVTMEESGVTKVITIRLEGEKEHMEKTVMDENFEEEEVPPEEGVIIPPRPARRIRGSRICKY